MASFVPEPIEKCAVWAASPSSTTLPRCQLSLRTSRKLVHSERLLMSRWPCSSSANSASQACSDSASSIASKPSRRHVCSGHSTIHVLVCSSKG